MPDEHTGGAAASTVRDETAPARGGETRAGRDASAATGAGFDDPALVDGRRARGRRTRESILEAAVDLASVEGLDGLTIGRLAGALGMSKSGLFSHFGSKEELQLATIDAAREIFVAEVITPAREAERGLPRLKALVDNWLAYMRREVFRGGCFFDAVRNEYDSRQPGPVRDVIQADFAAWSEILVKRVKAAQSAGHLDPEADPEQLAFELDALGGAANVRFQLDRDEAAFERASRAMHARLHVLAIQT